MFLKDAILSKIILAKDRVVWKMRWLFPNIMMSSMDEESDREENFSTISEEAEEIKVEMVWGAEVYGPEEAESLCDNLTRLRWVAGSGLSSYETAAEWIRQQRLYGTGGFYNVGVVASPKNAHGFILPVNQMELPPGVISLSVVIFQITSALTCVVVGFVLDDSIKKSYVGILGKDVKGRYFRMSKSSISRCSPSQLKKKLIEKNRDRIRNIAHSWFKKNLPGFFSNTNLSALPTAELIASNITSIFSGRKSVGFAWKDVLVSVRNYNVWSAQTSQGIKIASEHNDMEEGELHLVVSLCKADVDPEVVSLYGGGPEKYLRHADQLLPEAISGFASLTYLAETLKNLKLSRSSLQFIGLDRNKQVGVLESIQVFFDRSLGAPIIASELKKRAEFVNYFNRGYGDYKAPYWNSNNESRSLGLYFSEATTNLSDKILLEEHSLREHFAQLASIISIRESMRAQRRTETLSLLAVLIAAGSMVVTVLQSDTWVSEIRFFLVSLLHG